MRSAVTCRAMYKTVRHGENSLQYTILPQHEDGAGGGATAAGSRRRCKRGRRLGLVLAAASVLAGAAVAAALLLPLVTRGRPRQQPPPPAPSPVEGGDSNITEDSSATSPWTSTLATTSTTTTAASTTAPPTTVTSTSTTEKPATTTEAAASTSTVSPHTAEVDRDGSRFPSQEEAERGRTPSWLQHLADPSAYFQWREYADGLVLPALLGVFLSLLLLLLGVCYVLRRRRQNKIRRQTIGKISSDLQCGDKATLLPDGGSEED